MGQSKFSQTEKSTIIGYLHAEPNSHFWTDLNQIVSLFECTLDVIKDYLLIGLKNCIKNGYKLKSISNKKFDNTVFTSIEEMMKYIHSEDYNPKEFYVLLNQTINAGLNLTNGLKMERSLVYERIDGERDYQDMKWSPLREADGAPDEMKPIAEWINYMEFHIAKAKNAVYYLKTQEALAEIRKVTALGVRTMEIHGCPARENGEILNTSDLDPTTYKLNEDKPCCGGNCECNK